MMHAKSGYRAVSGVRARGAPVDQPSTGAEMRGRRGREGERERVHGGVSATEHRHPLHWYYAPRGGSDATA